MGKSHRDNHKARLKRGAVAFAKKAARRAPPVRPKCLICGTAAREQAGGVCNRCLNRS